MADEEKKKVPQAGNEGNAGDGSPKDPDFKGADDPDSNPDAGKSAKDGEASGEEGNETQEEKKKKQSAAENAKFAEKRRLAEEKQRAAELEAERKKGYNDGVKASIGGVNPFTKRPISDDVDLQEYLDMKTLSDNGKDPTEDYPQFVKEKARSAKKLSEEQELSKKEANKQIQEFEAKYPGLSDKILNDSDFMEYAEGKLGPKPLITVYESYLAFTNKLSGGAAARRAAKSTASPGSMTGEGEETKKPAWQTAKPGTKEFNDIVEKAKRGELK